MKKKLLKDDDEKSKLNEKRKNSIPKKNKVFELPKNLFQNIQNIERFEKIEQDNKEEVENKRKNYELSLINKNYIKQQHIPITKEKAKNSFDDILFPIVLKTTIGGIFHVDNHVELQQIQTEYKSGDCIKLSYNNNYIGYQ